MRTADERLTASVKRGARLVLSLLFTTLLLSGCDDSKAEYGKALKKYEALISKATPVTDPAYDEILAELDAVKQGDAAADAKKLAEAIRTLRAPRALPPRPLARANADDAALTKKAMECAELAKTLGRTAPDAGRDAVQAQLAACKTEQEKLDVALMHAQDPVGQVEVGHDQPALDAGR